MLSLIIVCLISIALSIKWAPVGYSDEPVKVYKGSTAETIFNKARKRSNDYIEAIVNKQMESAKEDKPIKYVYTIKEDFVPGTKGVIKAETKQFLKNKKNTAYAHPLIKVGLLPSETLLDYFGKTVEIKNGVTYSIIEINVECTNTRSKNAAGIDVYTEGKENFHLTLEPAVLRTNYEAYGTFPNFDEMYDRKFPLKIPKKCYKVVSIPSDEIPKSSSQKKMLKKIDLLLLDKNAFINFQKKSSVTWANIPYKDNPIVAYPQSIAGITLDRAKKRNNEYIKTIVERQMENARQLKPIRYAYIIKEDFIGGNIQAKTKQFIKKNTAYPYPLIKVGLLPTEALLSHIQQTHGVKNNIKYSVIEIDIQCTNENDINKANIGVYTEAIDSYHLTFNPAFLKSISSQYGNDAKLAQIYEQQFPLIIPEKCYDTVSIPSDEVAKAARNRKMFESIDLLLKKYNVFINYGATKAFNIQWGLNKGKSKQFHIDSNKGKTKQFVMDWIKGTHKVFRPRWKKDKTLTDENIESAQFIPNYQSGDSSSDSTSTGSGKMSGTHLYGKTIDSTSSDGGEIGAGYRS